MSIDEELLRELGSAPIAPTYRPQAEIAARARTLRRRRNALRGGVALAAAGAVVAATVVALQPSPDEPQPAHGPAPIAVSCPRQAAPKVPLTAVENLVVLPPDVPISSLEAHQSLVGCRSFAATWQLTEDQRAIAGVYSAFDASALPTYRGPGDLPGRYESRVIANVRVKEWRVDKPRRQLRAYWTTPAGRTFGAHAENFDYADQYLEEAVRTSIGPSGQLVFEPPSPGISYVRAGFDVPGAGTVELTVSSVFVGPPAPVGARLVAVAGAEQGTWWEADGIGHLSWHVNLPDGYGAGRSLTGRNLTPQRAVRIAASLTLTPLSDPRIPQG